MHDYQRQFIEFAISSDVLRFGDFTLKSGRRSPYFFNAGNFNDGTRLLRLGRFYRDAIEQSGIAFDMLFGPAYKGIPLASAVAMAYAEMGRTVPFCFDRKEAKDHGEGGMTFGAPLAGRVLIVDDVVTAGTSVNHSVGLIRAAGAVPAGVVVALDRQEKGPDGGASAIETLEQRHGLAVISVITLDQLVQFLEERDGAGEALSAIRRYREEYGAPARGADHGGTAGV